MSEQLDFFDDVDFDGIEAPTTEARAYPKLRPQSWYAGKIIEQDTEVTKGGAKCIRTVLAPMDGEGNTSKPTCRHKLWLPRAKVDENGNRVPWKGWSFLRNFAQALEGREVIPYPITKYKGMFKDSNGNAVTEEEAILFNKELKETINAYIKDVGLNLGSKVGKEVFFKTTALEDGKYVNVDLLTDQLPDGAELLTDPDTWYIV